MASNFALIEWYLASSVSFDLFSRWYEDSSTTDDIKSGKAAPPRQFLALKQELGLSVVNYVREKADRILGCSHQCYPSPVKTPLPSKYDYKSPAKNAKRNTSDSISDHSLKTKITDKRHRVQLLKSTGDQGKRTTLDEESHLQNGPMDALGQEQRISKLEERFNEIVPQNVKKQNEYHNSNASQRPKGSRRSLDSAFRAQGHTNNNGLAEKPKKNMGKSNSAGSLNLGDFLFVKEGGSKQGKKNKRKKGNRSLSPTTNVPVNKQNIETSREKLEEPEKAKVYHKIPPAFEKQELWATITNAIEQRSTSPDPLWNQIQSSIEKSKLSNDKVEIPVTPKKTSALAAAAAKTAKMVKADPNRVSEEEKLDKLSLLYGYCIENNLVVNLSAEIYIMMELLAAQETEDSEAIQAQLDSQKSILNSVHNCVYFACNVLTQNDYLLELLDHATLDLLLNNDRLELFSPTLRSILKALLKVRRKCGRSRHPSTSAAGATLESVRFHSEEDNAENFPTERAFQDFKKQRDKFYEIVREWKSDQDQNIERFGSRKDPSDTPKYFGQISKFEEKFGPKIKELLQIQRHPTNLLHFAKLFVGQLLAMCGQNNRPAFDKNDPCNKPTLKKINPVTLNKLEKWFNTKEAMNVSELGLGSDDKNFAGHEEFFKDFVRTCHDICFLVHFKDVIVKLIETKSRDAEALRDEQRDISQLNRDNSESTFCEKVVSEFSRLLSELKLGGKFLGFVESLPFRCQPQYLNEKLLSSQLELREKCLPSIDIYQSLLRSLKSKSVMLTLPWVIEYCRILDVVSLQSKFILKIIELMTHIYKSLLLRSKSQVYHLNPSNALFLTLALGDFFENPLIPRELFFNTRKRSQIILSEIVQDTGDAQINSRDLKMDEICLVSHDLVSFSNYPYLKELQRVLLQFSEGFKASVPILNASQKNRIKRDQADRLKGRKMRVNSEKSSISLVQQSSRDDDDKNSIEKLQIQKCSNFFHNRSSTISKAVNFVSENISANLISKIYREFMPQSCAKVRLHFQTSLSPLLPLSGNEQDLRNILYDLKSQIKDLKVKHYRDIRRKAQRYLSEKGMERITYMLSMTLPENLPPAAFHLCQQIALKQASNQVLEWTKNHVTERALDEKFRPILEKEGRDAFVYGSSPLEMSAELFEAESTQIEEVQKANAFVEESNSKGRTTVVDYPSDIVIRVKRLVNGKIQSITVQEIEEWLSEMEQFFSHCLESKVSHIGKKGVEAASVDLATDLIAYHPECMTADIQDHFVRLWSVHMGHSTIALEKLMSVISRESMAMFSKAKDPRTTWNKLEHFIGRLLASNLLSPLILEDRCLKLARIEWPEELLQRLASCMKGVVESWTVACVQAKGMPRDEATEDFAQVLDWLVMFWQKSENDFDENFPELF